MEEMDSKSGMEGLAKDECELDEWCYKEEDKRGRVHLKYRHVSCDLLYFNGSISSFSGFLCSREVKVDFIAMQFPSYSLLSAATDCRVVFSSSQDIQQQQSGWVFWLTVIL